MELDVVLSSVKKTRKNNCESKFMTPVDAAGGYCYQISTAMQVSSTASLGGVRLSNAWSIYRREGDNLGKLRLIPHRLVILE